MKPRSPIAFATLFVAGCSDVQHRVPWEVEPGELAVVAVARGDALETAIVDAAASVRIQFPPQSTMVVWRFSAGAFVDAAGHPVGAEALAEVQVTTEPTGGCGRCTYEAVAAPQRVGAGDVCAIPPFGEVEVYENTGDVRRIEAPDLARSIGRRVFLRWPGACPCEDRPPKAATAVVLRQIDDGDDGHVATSVHHLFADGTVLGITPGYGVAVDPTGRLRSASIPRITGRVFAKSERRDGLLLAFADAERNHAATYVHVAKDLEVTVVEGLPDVLGPAFASGDADTLFVAGRRSDGTGGHAAYRCASSSTFDFTCTEEVTRPGACIDTTFELFRGLATSSTTGTSLFVGARGQLYVRNAEDATWTCHPGLSPFGFDVGADRYVHDVVDDVALDANDLLYVCSTGERPVGPTSRRITGIVWATALAGVREASDLSEPLRAVEVDKAEDALCTSLSTDSTGLGVRIVYGFGDFVVDAVDGLVAGRLRGFGQPWSGAAPDLLAEAEDPVLDYHEASGWALAVTAARWMYRRAPDATAFAPVYVGRGARRGPMTALAPAEPGRIVAFGARVESYERGESTRREAIVVDGFPPYPDGHADVALIAPGAPSQALVASHRADLWRCDVRDTKRTPCIPPAVPREVVVQQIDLARGVVVDEDVPPVAQPAAFVSGAVIADDVFVLLDARSNVFAKIDGALRRLRVEWDDPTTEPQEQAPGAVTWASIDAADGVAWIVGRGALGRVAWRPDRTLVVEGFWHARLGAPWEPEGAGETIPFVVETWCADRGVILGMTTTPSGLPPTSLSHWELGADDELTLVPLEVVDGDSAQRSFTKPLAYVRPSGALRFADGTLVPYYDDGTVEPGAGRSRIAPFGEVGGHVVSGDFAVVGGEGGRILAVEVQ